MKVIIAGSRSIALNPEQMQKIVDRSGLTITELFSGDARGVDASGNAWARRHHIPIMHFPALWDKHGRSAGMVRNQLMASRADALIALWDGSSPGTAHMIRTAREQHLIVKVYRLKGAADPIHERIAPGQHEIGTLSDVPSGERY